MTYKKLTLAFLLLMVSCLSMAERLSVAQAQKFLHFSGLNHSLESLPEFMVPQFNLELLREQNESVCNQVEPIFEAAFSDISTQELSLNYLINTAESSDLIKSIAFLETDLGKNIVAAENRTNTPGNKGEIQAYFAELASNIPSEEREKLVTSLNQSLRMNETVLNMLKGMMFSVVEIIQELDPDVSVIKLKEDLEIEWEKFKGEFAPQMEEEMKLISYYTYQDISNEDLSLYIEFLNSKEGQTYWSASIDIFNLYLKEWIKNIVIRASDS